MRVSGECFAALLKSSLLFKFKGLSNLLAMAIAVQGDANSGLISGLSLKDSKGLAKICLWCVHL